MVKLDEELAELKGLMRETSVHLQHQAANFKEFKASVEHRFNQIEEHQRKNDTQTAVEIATLSAHVEAQTKAIEGKGGFRDRTPPDGNLIGP